jgi:hypothetical protein
MIHINMSLMDKQQEGLNWIQQPINEINWDRLLSICQSDVYLSILNMKVYLLQTENYWDKVSVIIDQCPHALLIQCLARAYAETENGSGYVKKKSFCSFRSMIIPVLHCHDVNHRDLFLKHVLIEWNNIAPQTAMSSIVALVFDYYNIIEHHHNDSARQEYREVADLIYQYMPLEVREFFTSVNGKIVWRVIKRCQSAGILSNEIVEIVEDIVVKKLGLPMIDFEPIKLGDILTQLGWKPMPQTGPHYVDDSLITKVVEIGQLCYLTRPCQHDVIVLLQDGQQEKRLMTRVEIVKLYERLGVLLPSDWKQHFEEK